MIRYLIILWVFLGPFLTDSIHAQLSPGPLSEAHAHLSGMTNCLTCHTLGDQDLSPKCLECHSPIQNRINSEVGFHGQLEDKICVDCHSDHKDREFQMIHWDPSKLDFDHDNMNFTIDGKHVDLECEDCHNKSFVISSDMLDYAAKTKTTDVLHSTFLGLGTACSDCHSDVHHDEFPNQICQDCHTTKNWLEVRTTFDHATETDFPLKGAHQDLKCETCHEDQQPKIEDFQVQKFSGLAFESCTDCHKDEHNNTFGQDCLQCHTETSFKSNLAKDAFNHGTTRYILVGKHQDVKCAICHTQAGQFKLTESFDECSDCHSDYHEGAFQKSDRYLTCDQCHSTKGFSPPLFGVKEHRDTRFPLEGSHLAQPCTFCHTQEDTAIYHFEPLDCEACHDNVHGDQFTNQLEYVKGCESCHASTDWSDLLFNHDETDFPLVFKHAAAVCSDCHKASNSIIQYGGTDSKCGACHADAHEGQFMNEDCNQCHSEEKWKIPKFDHVVLTEFPLDGQHKDLSCGQCHKFEVELNTIRFKPIAHTCQDCHNFGDFK